MNPHLAIYGVLTNGVEMLIYARTNGQFPEQLRFNLSETTEAQARDVADWLRKQAVHLEALESVLERLRYHRQNVLLIRDPDSEAARIFFQVFHSVPSRRSAVWSFLLRTSFPRLRKSHALRVDHSISGRGPMPAISYKNVPASWRDFLGSKSKAEITQFLICFGDRLQHHFAADSWRRPPTINTFPTCVHPRIHESLNELAVRGKLTPDKHRQIVERCFIRASEVLFATISCKASRLVDGMPR